MPIKLTVRESIAAFQAIEQLPKLPDAKIGYHLGRVADFCEQENRRYEKERNKLVQEMAEAPDAEGNCKIKPGMMATFTERSDAMLDAEVEIPREAVTLAQVLGADEKKRPEILPSVWRVLGKIVVEE